MKLFGPDAGSYGGSGKGSSESVPPTPSKPERPWKRPESEAAPEKPSGASERVWPADGQPDWTPAKARAARIVGAERGKKIREGLEAHLSDERFYELQDYGDAGRTSPASRSKEETELLIDLHGFRHPKAQERPVPSREERLRARISALDGAEEWGAPSAGNPFAEERDTEVSAVRPALPQDTDIDSATIRRMRNEWEDEFGESSSRVA